MILRHLILRSHFSLPIVSITARSTVGCGPCVIPCECGPPAVGGHWFTGLPSLGAHVRVASSEPGHRAAANMMESEEEEVENGEEEEDEKILSCDFDESDDDKDGEWCVEGELSAGLVLQNVVGDSSTMPDYVRVQVQRVQALVAAKQPLGLDANGFVPEKKIGTGAAHRRPVVEEFQRPRMRFFLPEVDYDCPRPKCPVCTTNDRTAVKG